MTTKNCICYSKTELPRTSTCLMNNIKNLINKVITNLSIPFFGLNESVACFEKDSKPKPLYCKHDKIARMRFSIDVLKVAAANMHIQRLRETSKLLFLPQLCAALTVFLFISKIFM